MSRLIIITLLIAVLTACTPLTTAPAPTSMPTPANGEPSYAPRPTDSELKRDNAWLDSIKLANNLTELESYPLQFVLELTGNLPTPCHKLRVAVSPPDADHKIVAIIYSVTDPNTFCAQMLEPFEANVPLGSYPAGHYYLIVNGKQIAEFDS